MLKNGKNINWAIENCKEIVHTTFKSWDELKNNLMNDPYLTIVDVHNPMKLRVGFVVLENKEWHTRRLCDCDLRKYRN